MAAMSGMAVGSLLVCFVLLLAFRNCQAITEPSEVKALLDIKAAMGNDTKLATWNMSSDPCNSSWQGIICTPASQGGNRHVSGIQLPGNNLSGTLSPAIGQLTSLTLLDLNSNQLSGDMPQEVGKLTQLQRFVIHFNGFSGPLIPWLPKLTNLRIADFGLNHFSGPFPEELGGALNTLQNLDCTHCSLSGAIPASVGLLSSLQMLGLGSNNLSGPIPPELGSIGGLQVLSLENNTLSGSMPAEIASLTNLQILVMANNNLTGPLPEGLLQNAAVLARFDGNPLCAVPEYAQVCSGPPLPRFPGPGGPGTLPGGPGTLPGGPGTLPGGPPNITTLAPVSAPLPAMAGGPYPGSLTGGPPAPSSQPGVTPSENASSFVAVAAPVTTGQTQNALLAVPKSNGTGSSFPLGATLGIVSGGAAVVALSVFFVLIFARRKRHEDDSSSSAKGKALLGSATSSGPVPVPKTESDVWTLSSRPTTGSHASSSLQISGDYIELELGGVVAPLLFTFKELQKLTDGFDTTRQVGEGGFGKVYWARVKDQDVAIKRLEKDAAMSAKQGEKQFRTEVDVLSRVRHPNLLALIGYCADGGERALVYPLMQHHSLFDQLHRSQAPCPALSSWRQRLTIAAQSASALAYLHDEASPPIIHRDFTSSNVLLDGNWMAVVSDFGLAKLMSKAGAPSTVQSTRLHGTLGYLAPEYLRGRVTEKNDVYSFGVVLLELLSGRRAAVSEEFDLVNWAIETIDRPSFAVQNLLDHAVKDDAPVTLLEVAVRTARACVETDPKRRPRMQEVFRTLVSELENTFGEDPSLSIGKPSPLTGPEGEAHTVVEIAEESI